MSFFSEDLIALTEVSVTAGQFVFMGQYIVDQSGCRGADRLQVHYGDIVGSAIRMRPDDSCYRGSVQNAERDDRAKREFLSRATEDLREGGWASVIQQQLSQ